MKLRVNFSFKLVTLTFVGGLIFSSAAMSQQYGRQSFAIPTSPDSSTIRAFRQHLER